MNFYAPELMNLAAAPKNVDLIEIFENGSKIGKISNKMAAAGSLFDPVFISKGPLNMDHV